MTNRDRAQFFQTRLRDALGDSAHVEVLPPEHEQSYFRSTVKEGKIVPSNYCVKIAKAPISFAFEMHEIDVDQAIDATPESLRQWISDREACVTAPPPAGAPRNSLNVLS